MSFSFFKAFASPRMVQLLCVPISLLCFFKAVGWPGHRPFLCYPLPTPRPVISPKMFLFVSRQMKLHGPFLPSFPEQRLAQGRERKTEKVNFSAPAEQSAAPASEGHGDQSRLRRSWRCAGHIHHAPS